MRPIPESSCVRRHGASRAAYANTILLLRPTDLVRFVPSVTANGAAPLTFKTWDPTLGVGSPGPSNLSPTGLGFGAGPGTAVLDLVLSVGATLNPVAPGGPPSDPATFGSLMSATRVVGTNLGVAVVTTKGTGQWEYRPAEATAWTPVGAVSALKALFLNATDEVRFTAAAAALPQTASLSFKAWDKTKVAPVTRGPAAGASVSKQTEVLTIAVGNTRPVLDTTPDVSLPAVSSSSPVPSAGVTVKALLGTAVTDTANALKGIAITATVNTNGKWQYALGTVFVDVGPVSPGSALLLPDTAKIRFVPNSGFIGTATISYKAWDRTAGQAADRIDTGGALDSFSIDVETASITVTR